MTDSLTPEAIKAHHRNIVDQIVSNLRTLEDSGAFESIYLHTRSQVSLFPREDRQGTPSEVLAKTLFGPWTAEEGSHCQFLEEKLDRLRGARVENKLANQKLRRPLLSPSATGSQSQRSSSRYRLGCFMP